jgi:hypothetical protein
MHPTTRQRHRKRQHVLEVYGDGLEAPCQGGCGEMLTLETLTLDRYPIPGKWGGTYRNDNIRPMCVACNTAHVGEPGSESIRLGLTHRMLIRA